MVLSILCKYGMWKKLPEIFWFMFMPKYYYLVQFFSAKAPIWILGKLESFLASHRLFAVLMNGYLVFSKH